MIGGWKFNHKYIYLSSKLLSIWHNKCLSFLFDCYDNVFYSELTMHIYVRILYYLALSSSNQNSFIVKRSHLYIHDLIVILSSITY